MSTTKSMSSSPDESEQIESGSESSDNDQSTSHSDSDSDADPEVLRCPICISRFRHQPVGMPDSCDHQFCFDCLQEWSRNVNSCPIDRLAFNFICVKSSPTAPVEVHVPLEPKRAEPVEDVDDVTSCQICGHSDREDRLLLCDGCDEGFHLDCLTPALDSVPLGLWFCPHCQPNRTESPVPTTSASVSRAIPRTRATERVRARVARARRVEPGGKLLTRRRSKKRRRKRRVKIRRTSRNTKSDSGDYSRRRPHSDSRRIRKRKSSGGGRFTPPPRVCRLAEPNSMGFVSAATVKGRLAQHLGIAKTTSAPTVGPLGVTSTPLSLFGDQRRLLEFREEPDGPSTSSSVPMTMRAIRFDRPLPLPKAKKDRMDTQTRPSRSEVEPADFLDNIMASQQFLQVPSGKIEIRRDGSLELKSREEKMASSAVESPNSNGEVEILQSNIEVEILRHVTAKSTDATSSHAVEGSEGKVTIKTDRKAIATGAIGNRSMTEVSLTEIPLPAAEIRDLGVSLPHNSNFQQPNSPTDSSGTYHSAVLRLMGDSNDSSTKESAVGGSEDLPGYVRRRKPLLSTPPQLPDSTTNFSCSPQLPGLPSAKRLASEPVRSIDNVALSKKQKVGQPDRAHPAELKIVPSECEMDVERPDEDICLGNEPHRQIGAFAPGLLGPIPSPIRLAGRMPQQIPPANQSSREDVNMAAALAQLIEQNRLRHHQEMSSQHSNVRFMSVPPHQHLFGHSVRAGLSLFDSHLMLNAAGVIQPSTPPPFSLFGLGHNARLTQPLMIRPSLIGSQQGSQLDHFVLQQQQHSAVFLQQQNLLESLRAANGHSDPNDFGVALLAGFPPEGIFRPQPAERIVREENFQPVLATPKIDLTGCSGSSFNSRNSVNFPLEEVVSHSTCTNVDSNVPPPPPPKPLESGGEKAKKSTASTVALILSSLGIADPSKISTEVLDMAVKLAKLKETASQQRQLKGVQPILRKTGHINSSEKSVVVTRSSTPSSPDSTSERFTEARKNLSDRLADAERHEAAGVSRVRFQPSCDDKIVDKEDKLSREELRQARRDEKLRKYMEATSTTVDLDSSEGNREKMFEKFNRQSGVEAAVKSVLKPFYSRRKISKDQYKEIMKKTVPKIAKKTREDEEINIDRVRDFVEIYVGRAMANETS